MKRSSLFVGVLLAALVLLTACNLFGGQKMPQDINAINTLAAQTIVARQTQAAFETLVAQVTLTAQSTPLAPTVEVIVASPTPQPTEIPTQPPATAVLPTSTAATPCNLVSFVADVSILDGTVFLPAETFTKTWRLKNSGSCEWPPETALIFVNGHAMNGAPATPINKTVKPGEMVDLTVRLTAPAESGKHTGNWMLRSNTGVVFGLGNAADKPFYVKIEVDNQATNNDANMTFDFTRNFCAAEWRNAGGVIACPSLNFDLKNGSIFRVLDTAMEKGFLDDEAGLMVAPNDGTGGILTGLYPAYKVKAGDRFKAIVGCADKAEACDVTFQVAYRKADGTIQVLGTYLEKYDGETSKIDLDLAGLVDQTLQFMLIVTNNGSSQGDQAAWFAPRITH